MEFSSQSLDLLFSLLPGSAPKGRLQTHPVTDNEVELSIAIEIMETGIGAAGRLGFNWLISTLELNRDLKLISLCE